MFSAPDAFVRTNRRAIAMMFVCLSVCLSVLEVGRESIVIVRCTLVYCLDVLCTITPNHVYLLPAVFFQVHLEQNRDMDVQTRRRIKGL